jgi:uncharacterized protein YbaR (Trm112 family)/SAM-dependent methyltransferase
MRLSLLDFVACPRCLSHLTLSEVSVPDPGEVETGVLACTACGAWYPVIKSLPELLPDHLRDWNRDRQWLESHSGALPTAHVQAWQQFRPGVDVAESGANFKLAEINLPSKIDNPAWWNPGYTSPFDPQWPDHTWHLIRSFAMAEPFLELAHGEIALDAGCGFAWTTEWLLRSGHTAVGVDLCREYLEIGLARVGGHRPHLVVGDIEHLPIRSAAVHAVLGFEAFHHLPNRGAAMREFHRVLRDGRPVVLVEPSGYHEHATVSVDAMATYGTLEVGMELEDVAGYAAGSGLVDCRRHDVIGEEVRADGLAPHLPQKTQLMANHMYTLRKPDVGPDAASRPGRGVALVYIDSPVSGATVQAGFRITGWAADAQSSSNPGVGGVHVWALPQNGGNDTAFLGTARLGEARPDVAASYGPQFGRAGWSLTTPALAPGKYNIQAYVWLDRTRSYEGAGATTVEVAKQNSDPAVPGLTGATPAGAAVPVRGPQPPSLLLIRLRSRLRRLWSSF